MLSRDQLKIVSNFLIDGSKIIFGSLVVGSFVPSIGESVSWVNVFIGAILATAFLVSAIALSKTT